VPAPTSLERIACLRSLCYVAWGVDRCPIIIKQQAASKNSNKKEKARELAIGEAMWPLDNKQQ
jgi:hypothetical protein